MFILLLFLTTNMAPQCDCNIYIPECYSICNMYVGRYLYNPNVYMTGKQPNMAIPVLNGYYRKPGIPISKAKNNTGVTIRNIGSNNTPMNNTNIRGVNINNVPGNNLITVNNTPMNNRHIKGFIIKTIDKSNKTSPSDRNTETNNNTSLDNRNIARIYNNKIEDTKKFTTAESINSTKSSNSTNTSAPITLNNTINSKPYSTSIEEICKLLSWLNGYQQSSENKITVLKDSIEKIKIKIFEIYDTDNIRCKISNEGTYNILKDSIKYKDVATSSLSNTLVNSSIHNNSTLCGSTSYFKGDGVNTCVSNNSTLCGSTPFLKNYHINTPVNSYKSISYSRYSYVTTITPFKYSYITEYPNTSYITENNEGRENKGVKVKKGNKTPLIKWKRKGHKNNTPIVPRKNKGHKNKTLEITEYPKTSYITTTMCFTTTPYKTLYVLRDNKGKPNSPKKKGLGSKGTVNNTLNSLNKDVETESLNNTPYTPLYNTTTIIRSETLDNTLYTTVIDTKKETVNNTLYTTVTDTKKETVNNTLYTTVIDTKKEIVNNTLYTTVTDTKKETVNNTLYTTVTDTKKETVNNTFYTTVIDTTKETVNNTLYTTVTDTKKETVNNTLYTTVTFNNTLTDIKKETIDKTFYTTVTAVKPLTVTNTVYTTVTNTIKETVNNIIPTTVTIRDIKNNLIPTTITVSDIKSKARDKNTVTTLVTYYTTTTIEYDISKENDNKENDSNDNEDELTPLNTRVSSSVLTLLNTRISSTVLTPLNTRVSSSVLTPLNTSVSSSILTPLNTSVSSTVLTPLNTEESSTVLTPIISNTITTSDLQPLNSYATTTSIITPFTFTLPLVTDNNKTIMIEELKGLFTQLIDLDNVRSDPNISSMSPIILFKNHSTCKNEIKEIKTCILTSEIKSNKNTKNTVDTELTKTDTFRNNNDSIINNVRLFKDIIGIL